LKFLIKEGKINKNEKILIKIAADGTNICRTVKLSNVVFSVVNEKKNAAGVSGCYRIGIFKYKKEDYESVKKWISTIWKLIRKMKLVSYSMSEQIVRDITGLSKRQIILKRMRRSDLWIHEIKYFCCCDWKMDAVILGLKAATSNHPCLWCEQHKDQLHLKGMF
jgi:hypothetical protein